MKKQRTKIMKNNTSGTTGVAEVESLKDGTRCFRPYCNVGGKRLFLGTFHSLTEAVAVRSKWESENGYLSEDVSLTKADKAVLLGLALGDGHLKKVTKHTACFRVDHGADQESYAHFKRDLLAKTLKCSVPTVKKYIRKNGHPAFILAKTDRYFSILRKALYKNGVKSYSKAILSRLTDEAVALWWMDDASVRVGRKDSPSYREAWLWTFTSKEDTSKIIEFFEKKYAITPKIAPRKSRVDACKWYYSLRFNKSDLKVLIPRLKPFACVSMSYKFPEL